LLSRFDGAPGHALIASADEAGFNSRYDVPGVSLAAFRDTSISADTLLDALSLHSVCTDASEREDTVAGAWSGSFELFTGCPGNPAVILLMVLEADDHVLVLHYQAVSSDDLDALDPVLESIAIDPRALP